MLQVFAVIFRPLVSLLFFGVISLASSSGEGIWIAAEGGVYRSELDNDTGRLSEPSLACSFGSGSFLAIHPELDVIYSSYQSKTESGYASLKAAGDEGKLEIQSVQLLPAGVGEPAHVAVSSSGRFLAGAHWGDQSCFVFELQGDGRISEKSIRLVQDGRGPGHSQNQSRPHCVTFTRGDSLLHCVDLGSDEIWTYHVGNLVEDISLSHKVKLPPGMGPRHLAMDSANQHAYLSGELNLSVASLFYDAETGRFSPLQYIPTVEEQAGAGGISLSEIQVHPSGRFVYAAVRGLDLMVCFAVDSETGILRLVERQDALVAWPRNFTLNDSGKWMIVAGRYSGDLQVFAVDQETGELEPMDSRIELKNPVCVRAWGRM